MCRLLGWATRVPTTLHDLLGQEDLTEFTELSCRHGDGWGMAFRAGREIEVCKRPDAARESDVFTDLARTHATDLGMVHLRWATLGLEVRPENTHPFTAGSVAFAHNGSVRPPDSLDRLLSAEARALRRGETDSERYFLAVLTQLREHPPGSALARTVHEIASSSRFTSLNCLLLTPDELYAVCRFDPAAAMAEETLDYFDLRYRADGDSVVIASTGWGRNWQPLADGEILVVRRKTLEVSVVPIEDMLVAS